MDFLDGIRVFVAAVDTGSFAQAGARLGISGKLASKYMAALEDRLGTRLLQRTTRKLGMTAAGESLYARAPAWLDEFEEMTSAINEPGRGLSGTLRVSAPVIFGEHQVQHLLRRFRALHPDLVIDLRLSDAYCDLAAEGTDAAIRIGALSDSALLARRLGATGLLLVASPGYLARHGTPQRLDDLGHHACLRDTNIRSRGGWDLTEEGVLRKIVVRGPYMVNSARAALELALAGEGIAMSPDYVIGPALRDGRLVRVLPHVEAPPLDIHVVYLAGRSMPRRLRAFLDFLAAHKRDLFDPAGSTP
ncbi:LysR family transcriptional regulator [Pseudooceanicola sediminis]|uniref:LysR family transcriptional regulator n=1 Tax=Pseudooceanicola sediminis TaxID=2211117 RepID=A0A399J824_9RHOB|nr:LysR family transcriptional regulator [Pseudooceanicola sediminis]KAA2315012.1 LysR family transcriptional regulator [Puniceibacterium sp. HSS470]RII38826.1 LysR family transcriptional regulator [Pseudooceanicola sediminis]